MALYLGVFVLSLVSCFIGLVLECLRGNVAHLKNGREPNASAALFPNVPIIPCLYLAGAWFLNARSENSGFITVVAYFCIASIIKAYHYKVLQAEFVRLSAKRLS
ncbi:MAG: hypothetical protein ACJ8GW_17255 [Massilia sp.]